MCGLFKRVCMCVPECMMSYGQWPVRCCVFAIQMCLCVVCDVLCDAVFCVCVVLE